MIRLTLLIAISFPFNTDYKIDSTNSTIDSFKTARLAGDPTPFAAALVIDMGVFGPDGLSERNLSYSNKSITYPLKPKEHTTIQQLVKSASSYEFVLHPGTWRLFVNVAITDG